MWTSQKSRMTLVLLPPSIDDELDEGKCWREGTSEWSVIGCVPSHRAQGCWEDVGPCHVIAWMRRPMAGQVTGVKHTAGSQHSWKGETLILSVRAKFIHSHTYTRSITQPAFRWLSSSFLLPLESIFLHYLFLILMPCVRQSGQGSCLYHLDFLGCTTWRLQCPVSSSYSSWYIDISFMPIQLV